MRKIVLLSMATLLFGILVFYFWGGSAPISTGPAESPSSISADTTSAEAHQPSSLTAPFQLKLDRSLSLDNVTFPVVTTPAITNEPDTDATGYAALLARNTTSSNTKSLGFLTTALLLGLLTGLLLKQPRQQLHATTDSSQTRSYDRTDSEFTANDVENSTLSKGLTDSGNKQTADNDASFSADLSQQHNIEAASKIQIADLTEEVHALRGNLASYSDEVEEAEARIRAHEQTIEELRSELAETESRLARDAESIAQKELLQDELNQHIQLAGNLRTEVEQLTALRQEDLGIRDRSERLEAELAEQEQLAQEQAIELTRLDTVLKEEQQRGSQAQSLASELKERDETIHELHADIGNWREQWSNQEDELGTLQRDIEQLRQANDAINSELAESSQLAEELRRTNIELEKQVEELTGQNAQIEDMRVDIKRLSDSEHTLTTDNESLRQQVELLSPRAEASEQLNQRVENLIADLDQSEQSRLDIQERVTQLREEQSDLEKRHAALEQLHSDLQGQLDEKATILEQTRDQLEKKSSQLESGNALHLLTESELRQTFESAEHYFTTAQSATSEIATLETILEESEANNSELSDSVELLREDLLDMANKINSKNDEIAAWQHQVSEEKHLVISHQSEIQELQNALHTEQHGNQLLSEKVQAAQQLDDKLNSWDNTVATYRNDIDRKNKLIDGLRDEIEIAANRIEIFKDQIREMDSQIEELQYLHDESKDVQRSLEEHNEKLDAHIMLLGEVGQEGERQQQSIDEFQIEIQEADKERSKWLQTMRDHAAANEQLEAELLDKFAVLSDASDSLSQSLEEFGISVDADEADTHNPDLINEKLKLLFTELRASKAAVIEHQQQLEEFQSHSETQHQEMIEQAQLIGGLESEHLQHVQQWAQTEAHLCEQAAQFQDEIVLLQDEVAQLDQARSQVQESLGLDLEQSQSLNRELEQTRDSLTEELQQKQTLAEELQEAHDTLTAELQQERTAAEDLHQKLSEHETRIEALSGEFESTQEAAQDLAENLETDLNAEREKNASLREQVNTLQERIEQQGTDLALTRNEMQEQLTASSENYKRQITQKFQQAQQRFQDKLVNLKDLLRQQQAINEMQKQKLVAQATQLENLTPSGPALPVLSKEVSEGKKSAPVPVLGQPVRDAQLNSDASSIPVLGQSAEKKPGDN